MGQIGHSSPQQWSEEFTAAYMGLPPPTRWSIQRANGKYKDHLVGQLTTIPRVHNLPSLAKCWLNPCVGVTNKQRFDNVPFQLQDKIGVHRTVLAGSAKSELWSLVHLTEHGNHVEIGDEVFSCHKIKNDTFAHPILRLFGSPSHPWHRLSSQGVSKDFCGKRFLFCITWGQ